MNTVVAVAGRGLVDEYSPLLRADDYGLTRGDGCFDATRVILKDGRAHPCHLAAHLTRFERSALAMSLPFDRSELTRLIDLALQAWTSEAEATLKMIITRGQEYTESTPTMVVTISPFPEAQLRQRSGLTVACLSRGMSSTAFTDAPWLLGGVKHLSYAVNMAAKREAASRGADDALFVTTDGYALEGPNAALLWLEGERLRTTQTVGTGILPSITQAACFAGARAEGFDASEDLISARDLLRCDGAWLASSIRGITPITHIDTTPIATNKAWTERLNAWAGFPTPNG